MTFPFTLALVSGTNGSCGGGGGAVTVTDRCHHVNVLFAASGLQNPGIIGSGPAQLCCVGDTSDPHPDFDGIEVQISTITDDGSPKEAVKGARAEQSNAGGTS